MDRKSRLNLIIAGGVIAVITIAGCSSTPKPTATPEEQMMAIGGYDIPMEPLTEGMAFGEPAPEDALILQDIHFDFDQSEILEAARIILDGVSDWMLKHPEAILQIEGHCDERGTKEYNLALGERRGLSVRSFLTGLTINPDRLHTISYGEEQPLCAESTEECWAQNRRAHFLVAYSEESETVLTDAPPALEPVAPEEAVIEIEEIYVVEESVPEPEPEPEPESPKRRTRSIGRYHQ